MPGPFGSGPVRLVRDTGPSTPQRDMDLSTEALAAFRPGAAGGAASQGRLRVHSPRPTAAFSRLDALAAGFPRAEDAVRKHGFTPVIRPAGGRLAAYHEGALVLDLVAPHPDPRRDIRERFAAGAERLAGGLRALGVDARVGPVPGEYCPGEFSVNAGGVAKLIGTAQRLTRYGYLFSAVVLVADPAPVRAVLRDAYAELAFEWNPATVGCVCDTVPGVTVEEVAAVLVPRFLGLLS